MLFAIALTIATLLSEPGRTTPTNPFCGDDCDQCTSFAEEYVHSQYGFWMDIDGDAGAWAAAAADRNWPVGDEPRPGAVMVIPGDELVWTRPDDGAPWQLAQVSEQGHVAIVDRVEGGFVHVLDRNWDGTGLNGARWIIPGADCSFIYPFP